MLVNLFLHLFLYIILYRFFILVTKDDFMSLIIIETSLIVFACNSKCDKSLLDIAIALVDIAKI